MLRSEVQGAAAGAVAIMFVGFYWGGWSLGSCRVIRTLVPRLWTRVPRCCLHRSTADKMAKERSELAHTGTSADKFRALPDAEAKLVALSKVDSWKRGDEFPKSS
jgi:hypothetical protein